MTSLKENLIALIEREGPLTIAQFMSAALHDPTNGYYATRPALGGDGDFITAPETSQMFGELIGLWCAQSWLELGRPAPLNLIEFGPGRGMMMADIWRAAGALPTFRETARVTLCETSPVLIEAQKQTLAEIKANWVSTLAEAPAGASLIVANEFLDCMPIRQFLRTDRGWREKLVGARDGALIFGLANEALPSEEWIPPALRGASEGAIAEIAPALPAFIDTLAQRLKAAPGRALFFDYGAAETTGGDTLQALRRHASADPLANPGAADLTAHVDFATVKRLAEADGLSVSGPISQGAWLNALGIETRAAALAKAAPAKADMIARQLNRLVGEDQMGGLFQVICLSSPNTPPATGFAIFPG